MTNQLCTPTAINLLKEEAEATIAFRIDFCAIDGESLSDSGFHLGHCASGFWIDIYGCAVAAVHDECALVHACFRTCNEIRVRDST